MTDMSSNGTVRTNALLNVREKNRREIDEKRSAIENLTTAKISSVKEISSKFSTQQQTTTEKLSAATIGLVSATDFKRKREELEAEQALIAQRKKDEENSTIRELNMASSGLKKQAPKTKKHVLSFGDEEEEEGNEECDNVKNDDEISNEPMLKMRKNNEVDTSFLPDKERDEQIEAERQKLKEEWLEEQRRIKEEDLPIVFSYWDGSGHRRSITVKKGNTIEEFIQKALHSLVGDFRELRHVTPDAMIYVKEDLIIPHHFSFYDFIVTKARGKSGPLFHFDAKDDVRWLADATVERMDTHAGKLMERRLYEKSKHIFPYSRFEVYDPTKKYDDKYTIA